MKKFILHFLIFSCIVFATIFYILSLANGYSDPYYLKLTTPKKANLILGTSKAAQGIQPNVLNKIFSKDFYNYSFSLGVSPYGKTYLNSVKQKLDTSKNNNIFILTIDALSICANNITPNDSLKFRENKSFLNNIKNINQNPNINYLLNYYEGNYYSFLFKNPSVCLHDNGWLAVSLNKNGIQRRTDFTIKSYKKKINSYHFSNTRFTYLLKTITFLKSYGKVYLVRLPVHPDLHKIEEMIMPNFDKTIQLAKDKASGYLDLKTLNNDLEYTDGVHLNNESGKKVSKLIAEWIYSQQSNIN